ncbi:SRPBCC family protein [Ramlibacter sp. PS4R-6]|uniref:SRPBCC family protein n=1 Tax=Ramlibacter sp. PS4R-6 TaxID=3133438 RepID=UPI0030AEE877
MQYRRTATNIGWIAGAAALAGAAAYLMRDQGVRVYRTIDNDIALAHTRDLARVSPEQMYTGAAVTVGLAGLLLWALKRDRGTTEGGIQQTEETIDINVPVSTAYNQWTQFEEFPRFMPTVESVKQLDDAHLHWKAKVAGKMKEWDSEITQQIPDQLIEWRSTGGVKNGGTVTFDKIGENKTRVCLRLWYSPEDATEKAGGLLGGVKLTAKGNLKRFKQLLERRGAETGAWRGEIAPAH